MTADRQNGGKFECGSARWGLKWMLVVMVATVGLQQADAANVADEGDGEEGNSVSLADQRDQLHAGQPISGASQHELMRRQQHYFRTLRSPNPISDDDDNPTFQQPGFAIHLDDPLGEDPSEDHYSRTQRSSPEPSRDNYLRSLRLPKSLDHYFRSLRNSQQAIRHLLRNNHNFRVMRSGPQQQQQQRPRERYFRPLRLPFKGQHYFRTMRTSPDSFLHESRSNNFLRFMRDSDFRTMVGRAGHYFRSLKRSPELAGDSNLEKRYGASYISRLMGYELQAPSATATTLRLPNGQETTIAEDIAEEIIACLNRMRQDRIHFGYGTPKKSSE